MKIVLVFISWGMPLIFGAYLYLLLSFVRSIKTNQKDFWESIGNPSNTDPNGQMKILKIIFYPKSLPDNIYAIYKRSIIAIRFSACLGLVFFFVVMLMIFCGAYNK